MSSDIIFRGDFFSPFHLISLYEIALPAPGVVKHNFNESLLNFSAVEGFIL